MTQRQPTDWTEQEPNEFFTEASDLGWGAGRYAKEVKIKDLVIPFSHFEKDREGEVRAFIYLLWKDGETVASATVFND